MQFKKKCAKKYMFCMFISSLMLMIINFEKLKDKLSFFSTLSAETVNHLPSTSNTGVLFHRLAAEICFISVKASKTGNFQVFHKPEVA